MDDGLEKGYTQRSPSCCFGWDAAIVVVAFFKNHSKPISFIFLGLLFDTACGRD
jgi:hypothetical protein